MSMKVLAASVVVVGVVAILVAEANTRRVQTSGSMQPPAEAKSRAEQDSIRRVLGEDDRLSAQYLRSRPASVAMYASEMAKISLAGCPTDFAEAFYRHSRAWAAHVVAVKNQPSDVVAEAALALLSGGTSAAVLAAGLHGAERGASAAKTTSNGIEASWTEVVALAIRHGVYWGVGDALPVARPLLQESERYQKALEDAESRVRYVPPDSANQHCPVCGKPSDARWTRVAGAARETTYFCSKTCMSEYVKTHR